MTPLYQELHRWMALPFNWEENNCCFVICDWIERVRGIDPAALDRWTFDDVGSCQRATNFFREPVAAFGKRMEAAGIKPGVDLRPGDVGVIRTTDERFPIAGLWTGHAWAFKSERGVITKRSSQCEVLAFWSVEYEE